MSPQQRYESGFEKDSVGIYLDQISQTPLLDAAREVELAKRVEAGLFAEQILHPELSQKMLPTSEEERIKKLGKLAATDDVFAEELEWLALDGEAAKQEFITANLRLSVSLARKYTRSGVPLEDLIQEANAGLIRAVEKFDFSKGFKFSTYATWWIRQSITRGIADKKRAVRLPVHVVEKINSVVRITKQLEQLLGYEPDVQEIAEEAGMTADEVIDLQQLNQPMISLDMPIGEDGDATLGDVFTQTNAYDGPESTYLASEDVDRLYAYLGTLKEREADIIVHRYGVGGREKLTYKEIGDRHGITAERTRQIIIETMRQLRRLAESEKVS